MTAALEFPVRVYFESFGNHSRRRVIGQIRRLADEEGWPGIVGKKGPNDRAGLAEGLPAHCLAKP